jgi:antitoxin HigA-1
MENGLMTMKTPPHPGLSVRFDCLGPLGLSVTAAAKALGVTRQALNNLVNERAGISPEMAIRLDKAFGGTAEAWLALQAAYDLAQARRRPLAIEVKRYPRKSRVQRLRAA